MILGPTGVPPAEVGLNDETYERWQKTFDVQSVVFVTELLPFIWELFPRGFHEATLLDVGPCTAAGTAFLEYLHAPTSFSRLKLKCTAIDLEGVYADYARRHFPNVDYVVGDIYDHAFRDKFDIVICSHTIEHVPEPARFLARLQQLARNRVIVAAPFDEEPRLEGHVNRLGYDFFEKNGALKIHLYRSMTWHNSLACVATFWGSGNGPLIGGRP